MENFIFCADFLSVFMLVFPKISKGTYLKAFQIF